MATDQQTTVSPATATTPRTIRVLIIDDSAADRDLLAIHLGKAWPFEHELAVETSAEATEAMEKMRATRFALIVLDWRLPGTDGGALLRSIRRQGVRIPVVVVSGLQRDDIEDNLVALGAAFLNKDEMNADTLHAAIAESLRLLGLTKPA